MFFSIKATLSLLAASATLAHGAIVDRRSVDNGSCAKLGQQCVAKVQTKLSNVWAIEPCLFAGVCFERNGTTLDAFLTNLWHAKGHNGTAPTSLKSKRVTSSVSV